MPVKLSPVEKLVAAFGRAVGIHGDVFGGGGGHGGGGHGGGGHGGGHGGFRGGGWGPGFLVPGYALVCEDDDDPDTCRRPSPLQRGYLIAGEDSSIVDLDTMMLEDGPALVVGCEMGCATDTAVKG